MWQHVDSYDVTLLSVGHSCHYTNLARVVFLDIYMYCLIIFHKNIIKQYIHYIINAWQIMISTLKRTVRIHLPIRFPERSSLSNWSRACRPLREAIRLAERFKLRSDSSGLKECSWLISLYDRSNLSSCRHPPRHMYVDLNRLIYINTAFL